VTGISAAKTGGVLVTTNNSNLCNEDDTVQFCAVSCLQPRGLAYVPDLSKYSSLILTATL